MKLNAFRGEYRIDRPAGVLVPLSPGCTLPLLLLRPCPEWDSLGGYPEAIVEIIFSGFAGRANPNSFCLAFHFSPTLRCWAWAGPDGDVELPEDFAKMFGDARARKTAQRCFYTVRVLLGPPR